MEKKIGKNVSSGAEKVEAVEKAAEGTSRDRVARQMQAAAEAEREAAEKRYEAAKARAAQKQAAQAEKQEKCRQKREAALRKKAERAEAAAARKSERAAYHAQKAARSKTLRHESEAEKKRRQDRERREKTARKKQREAAREEARAQREQAKKAAREKRAQARLRKKEAREKKRSEKKRAPGIGGWIAAVASLGTACLALAAVVTAGSVQMNKLNARVENGWRAALFEMVAVSEELDDNLSKLRVSAGAEEQRILLTDVLTDAAVMESALEKLPVSGAAGADISAFINRTGFFARRMLGKLAEGKALSAHEREIAERLYEVNAALSRELNELAVNTPQAELKAFFENADGTARFGEWGKAMHEAEEELRGAPFQGEGNVEENGVEKQAEVSAAEAEKLALEFFAGYHVAEARLTGETAARDMQCYNFVLTDENGTEIFAQVTKRGGNVVFFDLYEPCSVKNFDLAACDAIAREFLTAHGYEDMTAVWLSDTGMTACITYAAERDGVRYYTDMVQVRVCEEKGRVTGMDAAEYLLNRGNGGREFSPALGEEEARAMLMEGLEVTAQHLAVIPVRGREALCYEFACKYGEEEYLIYLDASSGSELRIFRVHQSARGSYLR